MGAKAAAVFALIVLAWAAPLVVAWPSMMALIPNGNAVKRNGALWQGVGHNQASGLGGENAFGNAFKAAGHVWTKEFCMADTDGDGFHNGWELGDPCCVWKVGATPARTTDITHPSYADSKPTSPGCVPPSPPSPPAPVRPPLPRRPPRPRRPAGPARPHQPARPGPSRPPAPAPPAPARRPRLRPPRSGPGPARPAPAPPGGSRGPWAAPRIVPAAPDLIQVTLLMDYGMWVATPAVWRAFATGIASVAGVPVDRIRLLSAISGSVIVSFAIMPGDDNDDVGAPLARIQAAINDRSLAPGGLAVDFSRTRVVWRGAAASGALPPGPQPQPPAESGPIPAPAQPGPEPAPAPGPDPAPAPVSDPAPAPVSDPAPAPVPDPAPAPDPTQSGSSPSPAPIGVESLRWLLLGLSLAAQIAVVVGALRILASPLLQGKIPFGPGRFLSFRPLGLWLDLTAGEASAVFFYIGLNAWWAVYFARASMKTDSWVGVTADVTGYLAQLQTLFILLPVARNSAWLPLIGVPWERAVRFHRWIGVLMVLSTAAHGVCMYLYYSGMGLGLDFILTWDASSAGPNNLAGAASGAALCALGLLSMPVIRRRLFELFYYAHILLFPVAFVLACLHLASTAAYAGPGVALLAIDWLLRLWKGRARSTEVLAIRRESPDVVRLDLRKRGFRASGPAQYVFLQVPSLAPLQWHPFSISSGPREDGELTLHVRTLGPSSWTGKLGALADAWAETLYVGRAEGCREPIAVRIDGPYGRPGLPLDRYRSVAFAVGGIGVTPALNALEWLVKDSEVLLRVDFLWSSRDEGTVRAFADQIERLRAKLEARGAVSRFVITVTRPAQGAPLPPALVASGRPDLSDFVAHASGGSSGAPVALFLCGPEGLVAGAERAAHEECRRGGSPFHVHKETFEL
eukprot:tig00020951_g16437.t1